MNKTRVITLARLRKLEPCADQYAIVARLYPSGVPLTTEAMAALEAAGVDTMWAGLRLLTAKQRSAFVIFTLRQRQTAMVTLFERVGLPEHAAAIEALRLQKLGDKKTAGKVFAAAASDVASDVASDAAASDAARAASNAAWAASNAAAPPASVAAGAASDAAWAAAWAASDVAWAPATRAAWDVASAGQRMWLLIELQEQGSGR